MLFSQSNRTALFTLLVFLVLGLDPAFAQSADWLAPAEGGAVAMTTSLVALGGSLLGLSIVGYGIWSALTHRIRWETLWVFVFSAVLVTVGPTAIAWLITKFQSGM